VRSRLGEREDPCHAFQVAMRDRVRLSTDVYLPPAAARHGQRAPVVLARCAYGRREQVACFPAIADALVDRGYAVVVQDIRGKYASEGTAAPFALTEISDAYDTLDWISAQPWAADAVTVIGDSYNGWLAWAAVASRHPALRGAVPGMTSTRIRDEWIHNNGTFCLSTTVDWTGVAWSGHENRFTEIDWARRPLREAAESILNGPTAAAAFQKWVSEPVGSPYWRSGTFHQVRPNRITIPALHLGGWWDFLRRGQLADWQSARRTATHQYLVMNCTDHHHVPLRGDPFLGTADEDDREFASRYTAIILPFLDFVSGRASLLPASPVRYQLAYGGSQESEEWPPAGTGPISLYLVDGLRSLTDAHGGGLSRRPAQRTTRVTWVHDPESLVPSTERDTFAMLVRPVDERIVQDREDVPTFTGPPLDHPMDLVGTSRLQLRSTITGARQFAAKLSDVLPDGRAFRITEGVCTLRQGLVDKNAIISFQPCAYRLRPGHSLRLEIAASHFPRYLPAAPTDPWKDLGTPATYTLLVGGPDGSRLDLSVRVAS
jgi:uncharacterized protein